MAFKIFLDANILLDFALKRGEYGPARALIEMGIGGRIQAFITPSVIHIVAYWLTKAYGKLKAKELLLTLLADVQVIDVNHEIS